MVKKIEKPKKICSKCQKPKIPEQFYMSPSPLHGDGKCPVCKDCLKELVDVKNLDSVKDVLRMIDRPFLYDLWRSSEIDPKDTFGVYMKNLGLKKFRDMTWGDSVFGVSDSQRIIENNDTSLLREEVSVNEDIYEKWGYGYTLEEYTFFEKKYNLLKNNYPEKTAMHTEALLNYIRYRVKEENATAKGLVKEAKEWGALAAKAATDAKINPSQLTKSDLSDGLDTFGQLVRSVEQAVDIIPILPQFKARPQDRADFTIWCYVNYLRDMKGLSLVEYEEIYRFYEERVKEYEDRYDFLKEDGE